jgi:hypothetical protein
MVTAPPVPTPAELVGISKIDRHGSVTRVVDGESMTRVARGRSRQAGDDLERRSNPLATPHMSLYVGPAIYGLQVDGPRRDLPPVPKPPRLSRSTGAGSPARRRSGGHAAWSHRELGDLA